jgi:hypothetical protein
MHGMKSICGFIDPLEAAKWGVPFLVGIGENMRKLIIGIPLLLLLACVLPKATLQGLTPPSVTSQAAQPTAAPPPVNTTASPNPPPSAGTLVYVTGSTQKVCQLTGNIDWETGLPTAARTFSNYGLDATDLGYPVENQGKLILLFGDSWPSTHPQNASAAQSEIPPDDSVGITTRTAPPDSRSCLDLVINHNAASKIIPPTITGPIKVNQGYFNVPSGGVSLGGLLYAFFWTDHCVSPNPLASSPLLPLARPQVNPLNDCPETDARNSLGKGVLAHSSDDGRTFVQGVPMPPGFVYTTAVNAELPVGLRADQRLGVFIFGVPRYRASIPYLAYAAPDSFADPASWHFFTGRDASGQPIWVTSSAWYQNPASTQSWSPPGNPELFSVASNAGRCVGEFSVTWNSVLGKWLMLYNCRGEIVARIASAPWGPWSAPTTILSVGPDVDCRLVMTAEGCGNRRDYWPTMHKNGKFEVGSFYAPYVLNRYTTVGISDNGNPKSTIYWLVSPWNPYEVTVMRTTLEVDSSPSSP